MKKFKSVLLLAALILIAAGAAFASNIAKSADDDSRDGYYIDNTTHQCMNSGKECTTVEGTFCTWKDPDTNIIYDLVELDGTSCGDNLYEPEPN
jgi:hypothetical protein